LSAVPARIRILFGCNPALGHWYPLAPLALAARDAGHDVRVASGEGLRAAVEHAGLRLEAMGPADLVSVIERVDRRPIEVWKRVFSDRIAEPLARGVLELAEQWRPDLVIHEDSELGTWIAADRLGIPHVVLQATAWRPVIYRASIEPQNRIRSSLGLPVDPRLDGLFRHRFLATRPPSLHEADSPYPPTAAPLRPVAFDRSAGESLPSWLHAPDGASRRRPRVVVTFGTAFAGGHDVIARILDGLGREPIDVIYTLGPSGDPGLLKRLPANVRAERYVPMSLLLPRCDALVFHGGSGTMLAALGAGLPLVIVPVGADQHDNARVCVAAGAARQLKSAEVTPESIVEAVGDVLEDRRYRERALGIRGEIESMPTPAATLTSLEELVTSQG
jgi:UDP:flavonoid glycosyltransferase YjiC (YdhE family)